MLPAIFPGNAIRSILLTAPFGFYFILWKIPAGLTENNIGTGRRNTLLRAYFLNLDYLP